jgi:hypothetical protein
MPQVSIMLRVSDPPGAQARLLRLYEDTEDARRGRAGSELVLAINRSDYMLDAPSSTLLQVVLCSVPMPAPSGPLSC